MEAEAGLTSESEISRVNVNHNIDSAQNAEWTMAYSQCDGEVCVC
jgi:hypothetical protein